MTNVEIIEALGREVRALVTLSKKAEYNGEAREAYAYGFAALRMDALIAEVTGLAMDEIEDPA